MHIIEMTAVELRHAMAERRLSPSEVLDAFIAQTERADPAVNAFTVTCFEEARAAAAASERRIMAGEPLGLLEGLPLAIKDMNLTKGMRTTFGSLIYADNVPDHDDLVVQFVREEGAVITGKTNTTEFGAGNNTTNRVFGPTVNPFDAKRTSGGSSGGAGAALACNMVPIAHGTDTGGSLRVPATFCGISSLKPTPGLIPFERRTFPFWPFQLHGGHGARPRHRSDELSARPRRLRQHPAGRSQGASRCLQRGPRVCADEPNDPARVPGADKALRRRVR